MSVNSNDLARIIGALKSVIQDIDAGNVSFGATTYFTKSGHTAANLRALLNRAGEYMDAMTGGSGSVAPSKKHGDV